MSIVRLAALLALVAVAVVTVLALRRTPMTPEEKVRAAVDAMAKAARSRDAAGVLEHVSERFQSPELGGKRELRAYLLGELLRGGAMEVRVLQSEVQVHGPDEVAYGARLLLGRTGGGLDLGERTVDATFAPEDGAWRVVRARVGR